MYKKSGEGRPVDEFLNFSISHFFLIQFIRYVMIRNA
jgi:hypothetical protein